MANRNLTPSESEHLVSAVLNAMLLLEDIDVLRDTEHYSGNIKKHGNIFVNCLSNLIKQNKVFQESNPRTCNNLFIDNVAFREKIVKCNVADLAIINQMYDKYKADPTTFEDAYEFKELKTKANV
jgi:hypothetical protein